MKKPFIEIYLAKRGYRPVPGRILWIAEKLNNFFQRIEARIERIKQRYADKWDKSFAKEHVCSMCNEERPGEFIDFDANPEKGIGGIAVCCTCCGTRFVSNRKEYLKLRAKAAQLREKNYFLWRSMGKNSDFNEEVKQEIEKNNKRIAEIMEEANALLIENQPLENSLATIFAKKNTSEKK